MPVQLPELVAHDPLIGRGAERAGSLGPHVGRDREVVSRSVEGPIVRSTYAQSHERAKRLYHRSGYRDHERYLLTKWIG